MITIEELAGVVEVLGFTNEDELYAIFKELAFLREHKAPPKNKIRELIKRAMKEHWIEVVHGTEFIVGPCAFPEVPDGLSEIIDVLEIDANRKIDWSEVASAKTAELKSEITALSKRIAALRRKRASKKRITELENEYQRLLELYYDFEFWLPCDLSRVREALSLVSKALESLKS
ncbi:MAG: hypothetical protein KKI07_04680 [Euryarchaeota archaeon]|nr:hypothetical protein [Euryarchaeota archaeon]